MPVNFKSDSLGEELTASNSERVFSALFAGGMTVGGGLLAFFNPTEAGFFPPCPLLALTGIACPGCGLTRGFHALLHGDLLTALDHNLLIPFFALFFGYLYVSLILTVFRGRGLSFTIFPAWSVGVFFTVAIVFGVVRNLPFYPFTFLFP